MAGGIRLGRKATFLWHVFVATMLLCMSGSVTLLHLVGPGTYLLIVVGCGLGFGWLIWKWGL
ncbi:MAG TPA: hypothetical protein VG013_14030 [Gemmataceae bacterium]|jgi:hypothetical protein|nr:hypothetical protein [Gemmataceae bacterium]